VGDVDSGRVAGSVGAVISRGARAQARKYAAALVGKLPRTEGYSLAESAGGATSERTQSRINDAGELTARAKCQYLGSVGKVANRVNTGAARMPCRMGTSWSGLAPIQPASSRLCLGIGPNSVLRAAVREPDGVADNLYAYVDRFSQHAYESVECERCD